MPVTDGTRVNVFNRRVMGAIDFRDRVLDFLEEGVLRHSKALVTGAGPDADPGVWFEPCTVADGSGLNDLTFGDMRASAGDGSLLSVDAGDARITDVPFEDAGATTYHLAARAAEYPAGVQAPTDGSGIIQYDRHTQTIGHLAEPTVVVDGGTFLTLTLGNHALDPLDDYTGRTAVVYLKTPVHGLAAVAIETVLVSGQDVITSGVLGQSAVSTTASDYEVVLLGPTITRSSSVASAPSWAYIGTVIGGGSPRTFDTSTQPQVVPVGELSSMFDDLLDKGWISPPTLSSTATTVTMTTVGTVYTAGRLLSTPSGVVLGSFPALSDVFVYYSVIDATFVQTTSWDTANSGSNVPIVWLTTDGSSNIVTGTLIHKRVQNLPRVVTLTLSEDVEHRAAFRTVRQALAAAAALQKGSTLTPPGVVIEVIGDVTTTTSIDELALYDAQALTFQGRAGGGGSGLKPGARLIWTMTAKGLFEVPSGATISGWRFCDLTLQHNAVALVAKCAVVSVVGTGDVQGLAFERCFVDGTGALSGFGGGAGRLPYLVYSESSGGGSHGSIYVIDCSVLTVDGIVRRTAAGGGLRDLRILGSSCDHTGVTHVAAAAYRAAVVCEGSSNADWTIRGNAFVVDGSVLHATRLQDAWITDNRFRTTTDDVVVDLGDTGFVGIKRVFVHSNLLEVSYSGGAVSVPMLRIRTINDGGKPAGLSIAGNQFKGDPTAGATGRGIRIDSDASDLDGVIIATNQIDDVGTGITLAGHVVSGVISGNWVQAQSVGIEVLDSSGGLAISGNWVKTTAGGTGILLDGALALGSALSGNVVKSSTNSTALNIDSQNCATVGNILVGDGTGSGIVFSRDHQIVLGNVIEVMTDTLSTVQNVCLVANHITEAALTVTHDKGSVVGNVFSGSLTASAASADLCVLGNFGTSFTDSGANTFANNET